MSDAEPLPLKHLEVHGARMAYAEIGAGPTILFQHGNPTSSYLWRNVMRPLADAGRCVAVDLIGMGGSDKLPDSGPMRYSFAEHQRHLYAAWDALGIGEGTVLVLHDWGSALGFEWARQNEEKVAGIVYMEGIVRPLAGWHEWSEAATPVFQALRSEAGEGMVLQKNVFVERILPGSTQSGLSDAVMTHYRAPFAEAGEGRRPTLDWPRQIPIAGEPPEVAEVVERYAAWLSQTDVPKLFINAEPGAILIGAQREFARTFKNQDEVTVPGNHFVQEDSADEIAAAIRTFLERVRG